MFQIGISVYVKLLESKNGDKAGLMGMGEKSPFQGSFLDV